MRESVSDSDPFLVELSSFSPCASWLLAGDCGRGEVRGRSGIVEGGRLFDEEVLGEAFGLSG